MTDQPKKTIASLASEGGDSSKSPMAQALDRAAAKSRERVRETKPRLSERYSGPVHMVRPAEKPEPISMRLDTMRQWSDEKLKMVLTREVGMTDRELDAGAREAIVLELLERQAMRSEQKQAWPIWLGVALAAIAAVASILALPQVQRHVSPEQQAAPVVQTPPTPQPQ